MEYYVNSKGEVVGRLYEVSNGFVAEIGWLGLESFTPFFATKSAKHKTHRQAEQYLYDNGCVSMAVA